jgi:hypothetical protein
MDLIVDDAWNQMQATGVDYFISAGGVRSIDGDNAVAVNQDIHAFNGVGQNNGCMSDQSFHGWGLVSAEFLIGAVSDEGSACGLT